MNKVNSVGLREIIGEKDVKKVYSILREKEVSVDSTTWNRRYREYMDKIKTGSVFEIAEVLRDLYLLRSDKDLSFGERKMLDTARSLLSSRSWPSPRTATSRTSRRTSRRSSTSPDPRPDPEVPSPEPAAPRPPRSPRPARRSR
jgi:hypothetical protein